MTDLIANLIVDTECKKAGIRYEDVKGRRQSKPFVRVRNAIAYRLWVETALSAAAIAKKIGRSDHSAASYAILGHAREIGLAVARISDLRQESARSDDLDWTKFAYAVAAWRDRFDLTLEKAARKAGISRREWRKAEKGQALSAGTLMRLCAATAFDPMSLLPVTHETAGKHYPQRSNGKAILPRKGADGQSAFMALEQEQ